MLADLVFAEFCFVSGILCSIFVVWCVSTQIKVYGAVRKVGDTLPNGDFKFNSARKRYREVMKKMHGLPRYEDYILYHFMFGVRARNIRRVKDEYLVVYPDGTLEYWKADECSTITRR